MKQNEIFKKWESLSTEQVPVRKAPGRPVVPPRPSTSNTATEQIPTVPPRPNQPRTQTPPRSPRSAIVPTKAQSTASSPRNIVAPTRSQSEASHFTRGEPKDVGRPDKPKWSGGAMSLGRRSVLPPTGGVGVLPIPRTKPASTTDDTATVAQQAIQESDERAQKRATILQEKRAAAARRMAEKREQKGNGTAFVPSSVSKERRKGMRISADAPILSSSRKSKDASNFIQPICTNNNNTPDSEASVEVVDKAVEETLSQTRNPRNAVRLTGPISVKDVSTALEAAPCAGQESSKDDSRKKLLAEARHSKEQSIEQQLEEGKKQKELERQKLLEDAKKAKEQALKLQEDERREKELERQRLLEDAKKAKAAAATRRIQEEEERKALEEQEKREKELERQRLLEEAKKSKELKQKELDIEARKIAEKNEERIKEEERIREERIQEEKRREEERKEAERKEQEQRKEEQRIKEEKRREEERKEEERQEKERREQEIRKEERIREEREKARQAAERKEQEQRKEEERRKQEQERTEQVRKDELLRQQREEERKEELIRQKKEEERKEELMRQKREDERKEELMRQKREDEKKEEFMRQKLEDVRKEELMKLKREQEKEKKTEMLRQRERQREREREKEEVQRKRESEKENQRIVGEDPHTQLHSKDISTTQTPPQPQPSGMAESFRSVFSFGWRKSGESNSQAETLDDELIMSPLEEAVPVNTTKETTLDNQLASKPMETQTNKEEENYKKNRDRRDSEKMNQILEKYVSVDTPEQLRYYVLTKSQSGGSKAIFVNLSGILLARGSRGTWLINPYGYCKIGERATQQEGGMMSLLTSWAKINDEEIVNLKGGIILSYKNQIWQLIRIPDDAYYPPIDTLPNNSPKKQRVQRISKELIELSRKNKEDRLSELREKRKSKSKSESELPWDAWSGKIDTILEQESSTETFVNYLSSDQGSLVHDLDSAVESICEYFEAGVSETQKQFLGDDKENKYIVSLVRGKFCTALANMYKHHFISSSLFGFGRSYHFWDFVERAVDQSESVISLSVLGLRNAIQSINSNYKMCDNKDVKFRSLVCCGLNNKFLHSWVKYHSKETKETAKFYREDAILRDQKQMHRILTILKRLKNLPFNLTIDYEFKIPKNIGKYSSETESPTTERKNTYKFADLIDSKKKKDEAHKQFMALSSGQKKHTTAEWRARRRSNIFVDPEYNSD